MVHAVLDSEPELREEERHPESHSSLDLGKPGTNYVVSRRFPAVDARYRSLYASSLAVRYRGQAVDGADFQHLLGDADAVRGWAGGRLESAGRALPAWMYAPFRSG
jgi:hypothetical protein